MLNIFRKWSIKTTVRPLVSSCTNLLLYLKGQTGSRQDVLYNHTTNKTIQRRTWHNVQSEITLCISAIRLMEAQQTAVSMHDFRLCYDYKIIRCAVDKWNNLHELGSIRRMPRKFADNLGMLLSVVGHVTQKWWLSTWGAIVTFGPLLWLKVWQLLDVVERANNHIAKQRNNFHFL